MMRSCVGGACAMTSEPFSMNGRTLACILFGGPILQHSAQSIVLEPFVKVTHPYFAIERSSSGFKFR